jgi:hypothetical protein
MRFSVEYILMEHEILKMGLCQDLNRWELTVVKADMIRIIKSEISASVEVA